MLHNYIKCQDYALPVSSAGSKTFADREAIAAYAQPAVGVLQQAGLLSGKNGSYFGPADTTTRAEAAAVLARLSALSTQ